MVELDEKTEDEKYQDRLDEMINECWASLLTTEGGRLLLWSILQKCGIHQHPHYDSGLDAVHKGRQQIGQELLDEFVWPHGMQFYTDMLLEAEVRDQEILAAMQITRENEDDENDD